MIRRRILTVDDSPTIRAMLLEALTGAGYDVVQAEHGNAALRMLQGTDVDLVITDVNMPVMGGLALLTQLRAAVEYEDLPVLVMTTETSQEFKQFGRDLGASGWVAKPFDPERLLAAVGRVLD